MNRSPTSATWAEKWFTERFVSAEIRSAGTHAYDGREASAFATDAMRELGFDMRSHRTSRLAPEHLAWADHVVVMEPMHRDVALKLDPSAADKIIPMWAFVDGGGDEVDDPHGGALDAYRASAKELGEATQALVAHILAERRRRRTGG